MLRKTFLIQLVILAVLSVTVATAQRETRVIQLSGSRNFRDIGGYPTENGRQIRWERVYRTDALSNLTAADYETISKLGIATVCDYRAPMERERDLTRWAGGPAPKFLLLDIMGAIPGRAGQDPSTSFIGELTKPNATTETASRMMSESMANMALNAGPLFGRMMRQLIEIDAPLLYHCTAGKDRTGLSTALLMKVLGATQSAIYEDYLLINTLMPPKQWAPEMAKRLETQSGVHVKPEVLEPLLGTRREWLDSSFQAIDREYGSFDAYRRKVLGLSDADVQQLRNRLTR